MNPGDLHRDEYKRLEAVLFVHCQYHVFDISINRM